MLGPTFHPDAIADGCTGAKRRYAEGRPERFQEFAAEMVRLKADRGHRRCSHVHRCRDYNAFTNTGSITGDFTFPSADSTLTNDGHIYGYVTLADPDTLNNAGIIDGNVTLEIAHRCAATGDQNITLPDTNRFAKR
jgi:hypothetical protein